MKPLKAKRSLRRQLPSWSSDRPSANQQVVRMIPPLADRSGITRTPRQLPLRARRMIGRYDNEDHIRRASRLRAGHRQVVG